MPAQPPKRELVQQTFENGIILGYSHREHEVPPGYCIRADNLIIQEDGSLAPRPGLMVTYANGYGTGGGTDVRWDQAITAQHRVICRDADNSLRVAGRTSATHVAIPFAGTTVPPGSDAFWSQFAIIGQAASYGNTTVVPLARVTYNSGSDPAGGPAPGRGAVITLVHFNNSATVPSSVGSVNLYDTNGHLIIQEAVQQQQATGDAVFARMVAISWKSRIFVIAGTQVTYSAPGQPTVYAAASGGGFFNLDTSSQIVGAFVLDDNLYMVTRQELFVFNFSSIPSIDGELRKIAKIQGLGGAEYDNIGYIAVREGLFRIVGGQLEPTFIPSAESHMSFQTYGWMDLTNPDEVPERIEIPPHCVISKVGDQILLSGIGTNLVELVDQSNVYNPVFSTTMEAWTVWYGRTRGIEAISRWFNLVTPLIRTDVQDQWGSEQYVGTNIEDRTENLASRMRSFIVINAENSDSSWDETGTQIKRWADTFVAAGQTTFQDATDIQPVLETPFYAFDDPIGLKRLHRLWMTGQFKPGNQVEAANSTIDDRNDVSVRAFLGPNDSIQVVNFDEIDSDSRLTPELFDISPRLIQFVGAMRFLYLGFRISMRLLDQDEPLLAVPDENYYKYPNIALSSIHFDITKYSSMSNRAY